MSKPYLFDLKDRRILQIGYGAIGSAMSHLYIRHLNFKVGNIVIIDMKSSTFQNEPSKITSKITFLDLKITRENFAQVYGEFLRPGDMLVDLAWYIDTLDQLKWCRENGVLYINTAVEDWPEDACGFFDKSCQTLYTRQMQIQDEVEKWGKSPTAILTHGANPGWVSHATKIGMRDWANYLLSKDPENKTLQRSVQYCREERFPEAAKLLNIQVIHISERDTQISKIPKQVGEFVNTWSPNGFIEEATAPAELGWGTHETLKEGVHGYRKGPKNQVYFDKMGMNTLIRSWVPSGDMVGMIVRHEEAFSISKYLTIHNKEGKATYRPTVHYVYWPSNDGFASLYEHQAIGYKPITKERVFRDDVISGRDELGVFMLSPKYGGWWIGSLLDFQTAKELLAPHSATVIQVASSVMAAIVYAFVNPREGVIHPEEMAADVTMKLILPYLGEFVSIPVDWQPPVMDPKYKSNKDWIIQKLLVQ